MRTERFWAVLWMWCTESNRTHFVREKLPWLFPPVVFEPTRRHILSARMSFRSLLTHIYHRICWIDTKRKKKNNNHEWLVFKYGLATGLLYKISCKGAVVAIGWCFLNILQIYSDCTCDAWGLLVGSGGENFFIMLQKNMHFQWG